MISLLLTGCSASESATRFGYWMDRGSSTFPSIYQCVNVSEPHLNKECNEGELW